MAEWEDAEFTSPHNKGTYQMLVGDFDTQEDGRTPQEPGRTCGGVRGRRSGGQMGPVPLRGGWGWGGVPTPGGTLRGSEDQGERV